MTYPRGRLIRTIFRNISINLFELKSPLKLSALITLKLSILELSEEQALQNAKEAEKNIIETAENEINDVITFKLKYLSKYLILKSIFLNFNYFQAVQ